MKIFSIFLLLVYWSVIILAPVVAKDEKANKIVIMPLEKPVN